MAVILISYATAHFFDSQRRLAASAKKNGIDEVILFNNIWLYLYNRAFIKKNRKHFQHKRGGGYWVWKPYIILKTLEKLDKEDYLIYLDAGIEIIKPLDKLLKICKKDGGIMLFSPLHYTNKDWTKRDVFVKLRCDSSFFHNSKQLEAGMMILKKNNFTLNFIKNWLELCTEYSLINDSQNNCTLPNFPSFKEHRHDQSLLTILALKQKLKAYRSPDQLSNNYKPPRYREDNEFLFAWELIPQQVQGEYAKEEMLAYDSPYPTLFNRHRTRNRIYSQKLPCYFFRMINDALAANHWLTNK